MRHSGPPRLILEVSLLETLRLHRRRRFQEDLSQRVDSHLLGALGHRLQPPNHSLARRVGVGGLPRLVRSQRGCPVRSAERAARKLLPGLALRDALHQLVWCGA